MLRINTVWFFRRIEVMKRSEEEMVLAVNAVRALTQRRRLQRKLSQRFLVQSIVLMGITPPRNSRILAHIPH
ncbi:MAG: hypothetical protein A3C02_00185 [Candidatus Andersenbacteria bacterium RIFCSPHIGHO2_02_FULL_45_11]|uniref:Uncharacterized protein n=1 Tax=Candidatus Andersenbacteria bacterium RIFCSPHIGHO2_12_FULL_45_11 TaxID=1797281 RepID=A0A1G1X0W5_9BACT|nr:MAG: hypothetical protein A2805_00985 [Candidatus Andersenbacteria bacterium RIFCSPHIGHO2_01_FULL_46_36]OGY33652.1 MAG: hypothetical protein A3D99_03845 [Candidatus Andersenbacteria bacterium RIFCSPHIGHO2_12_FULL_45_11]OGY34817.1 MAG: hypothetical protein A3C02_00185 [Candidatus Andersenbacteria bacterium RIFCSPHIGHO2_02_FULL_45_11]